MDDKQCSFMIAKEQVLSKDTAMSLTEKIILTPENRTNEVVH